MVRFWRNLASCCSFGVANLSLSGLYCVCSMPQFSYATLGNFSPTECTHLLLRLMGVMCSCQQESRPLQIFLVDLVETELTFIIAVFWADGCLISGTLMMFSALLYWTIGCGENIKLLTSQSYNFLHHWNIFCLCPFSHTITWALVPVAWWMWHCDTGGAPTPPPWLPAPGKLNHSSVAATVLTILLQFRAGSRW